MALSLSFSSQNISLGGQMCRRLITLIAVTAFATNESERNSTARAGPSRRSVGVEQVGDTLPKSGQETDWRKAAPTRNLY
jgi:hypothetical protein